jgi:predicted dehydrogenase
MRYALIGCGRISKYHIQAAVNNKLNIVALCDLNINQTLGIIETFNLKNVLIFSDYKEMITEIPIDVVAITTPSHLHVEIATRCMLQGIKAIVEKPFCMELSSANQLEKLNDQNRTLITVSHQNRFNSSVLRLKYAVQGQFLGKIFYIVASVRWNRNQVYYDQAEWRGKWRSDGGALMNQSIHNIDLLLWMMDSPVVEVFGYIDNKNHPSIEVEDMGVALLKFANGSFGIIESSMNTYPENFEETLSIFGEKGSVVLGGKSVNKIVHWNVKDDQIDDLEKFNEEVDSVYGNGHIALYKDFIEAIEQDREPAITLQDGRNAVEVILAIYLSSFEKRPVQLPLPADTSTIMFEGKSFK